MAPLRREPRDPADTRHRVTLSREQRDWINAAAAALEEHADHDEDPLAMLEAAAELRRIVGDWDVARDARPAEPVEQRLREALRQIANAESGVWGWIARRRARRPRGEEQRRHRRARRRRAGDSRRCDRRPRTRRAGAPMTRPRARRAAQPARAGRRHGAAATPGPLPARAARRGRTPRAAGSRAPRAPGARLARGPARLTQPRPWKRHRASDTSTQGERCTNRSGSARPTPTPRSHPPRRRSRGRPPTASRSRGRRARPTPAASCCAASRAGARRSTTCAGPRSCASHATSPSTPTTRTRGPAATSTPTRSCAATASPASRPTRLTLQAIGRLIDAQAAADREAGLDWTRITTPARALDPALRRAHARLGIDLDDPAVWTRRADQRAALARRLGLSDDQADDLSRWALEQPAAFDADDLRCWRIASGTWLRLADRQLPAVDTRRPARRRVRRASAGRERVAAGAGALARRDPARRRARRDARTRPHRRHAARRRRRRAAGANQPQHPARRTQGVPGLGRAALAGARARARQAGARERAARQARPLGPAARPPRQLHAAATAAPERARAARRHLPGARVHASAGSAPRRWPSATPSRAR